MVRKIIVVVVSIAILAGGSFLKKTLEDSKKPPIKKKEKQITTVFIEAVQNATLPILMEVTGTIEAKNRVELFAEVRLRQESVTVKVARWYPLIQKCTVLV
jgi:membrane fusion protein (multidrug efflux system)